MFDAAQYELIDFGGGRKLERFGSMLLDRTSPAAEAHYRAQPELWRTADARFELADSTKGVPSRGRWSIDHRPPSPWITQHRSAHFQLKLTDFGHVGIFPEQAPMWDWVAQQNARGRAQGAISGGGAEESRVLNLFAYTGGSTVAAATAGAEVTHVDAARNVVDWARRNAELSGVSSAPIRWIAEDALTFAQRELKRGRQYDSIILDPPSYGHGPSGEVWKIDEDLPVLLSVCRELIGERRGLVLLTCHAPQYDAPRLVELLARARFGSRNREFESGELWLSTTAGRRLHSGSFARTSH